MTRGEAMRHFSKEEKRRREDIDARYDDLQSLQDGSYKLADVAKLIKAASEYVDFRLEVEVEFHGRWLP